MLDCLLNLYIGLIFDIFIQLRNSLSKTSSDWFLKTFVWMLRFLGLLACLFWGLLVHVRLALNEPVDSIW
jgi:hypothetical protein